MPGGVELDSGRSTLVFHLPPSPCPGPLPNWDTPPATKFLPLWKITVPTTGWWGKMMHVERLHSPWCVALFSSMRADSAPRWACGTWEALSETMWNQQINGKYSHLLFFTDSMLLFIFSYLLKFICNLQIHTHGAFAVIVSMCKAVKILSHPMYMFPAEARQGVALPSYLQLSYVNKYAVLQSTWCHFSYFFHFCW